MIEVLPELGIEIPDDVSYVDLREKAQAAVATAESLALYGVDLTDCSDIDYQVAEAVATAYAADPEKTSKQVSDKVLSTMTPASLVMVNNILGEFGRIVVQDSVQIRQMVTNKLILETENEDAKVRLRALELLGKISDVGLFTEKREMTITHQTSDELRDSLRSKLAKLVNDVDIEDAEIIEYEGPLHG